MRNTEFVKGESSEKRKFEEVRQLVERIKQNEELYDFFYEAAAIYLPTVKEKYPSIESSEVGLYHLLAGSSLREGHTPQYYDYPESELYNFIVQQANKLLTNK